MLTFWIPFIGVVLSIVFIRGKTVLLSDLFWLISWWTLVIGNAIISGIYWGAEITIEAILFIIFSILFYVIGRFFGKRTPKKREPLFDSPPSSYRAAIILGVIGAIMFIFDYLRFNGLTTGKSSYTISIIGSIGMLLVPILLVMGLYRFGYIYYHYKKIDIWSVIMLIGYSAPGILNSGRQSIVLVLLALAITKVFCDCKMEFEGRRNRLSYKKIFQTIIIIIALAFVIGKIYTISLSRFTDNEIRIFLYKNYVPNDIVQEANLFGDMKYFYYTFLSYFGHQIAFLSSMLKNYNGPYLFGVFELNIISRRLPDFLGLDYAKVWSTVNQFDGGRFSGCWFTVLGSFIADFGRIGTIIACMICGYYVGKQIRYFRQDNSISSALIIILICMSMMSVIQIGPFYSTEIYGSFIWWFLIFIKGKKWLKTRGVIDAK